MEESILKTVADIGISGAVTFYLLFKFSKSIDGLTSAIANLIKQNEIQNERLEHHLTELIIRLEKERDK